MIAKMNAQIINASKYSMDGMSFLFRSEFAARLEVYGFVLMMATLLILQVSLPTLMIAVVLFLMLIAFEAVNTAIEVIIDRISPEISSTGKKAKDLGSFAVFCMLIVNGIFFAHAVITAQSVQSMASDILLALA